MTGLTQRLFPRLFEQPATVPAAPPPPTIATARLILRPLSGADLPALDRLYADPAVTRHLQNGPYRPARARRIARRALAAAAEEYAVFGHPAFALVERTTAEVIGCCGLSLLPAPGPERVELSYLLARHRWGSGLMTEAGRAVVDHAFGRLAIRTLFAVSDPDNHASIRLLIRLGFADDGFLHCYGRDLRCYVHRGRRRRDEYATGSPS